MRFRCKQQDFFGLSAAGKVSICSDANKVLDSSDLIENFHPAQKFFKGQCRPSLWFFSGYATREIGREWRPVRARTNAYTTIFLKLT